MGKTARYRMMTRYLRSAPTGEQPASGGGAAVAPPATPVPTAPATGPGPPATPAAVEQPLGEAGLKALQAERQLRKAAEDAKAELERQVAALNDKRPADQKVADQLRELTEQLATEKIARLRSQTALEHKITPDYAALLTATTAEDLAAQATLIANLQAAATATAATPATPGHQSHPGQGTPSSGEPPKKTLGDGAAAYEKFKTGGRAPQPASST